MTERKFGWIKDVTDDRDLKYTVKGIEPPPHVNLSYMNPYVYDQGSFGSCVFNAFGSMFRGRLRKQGHDFVPSRFFPYYNYRDSINAVSEDTGASMRDGCKMYVKYGTLPEWEWEYKPELFAVKPPDKCYDHAVKHQALQYSRVNQDMASLKTCLALGNTIAAGVRVYESFMQSSKGVIPMPKNGEKYYGGHAVEIVGYSDKIKQFIGKNSWGVDWGIHGYFFIPYDYITSPELSDDFWTITLVETD